MKKTLKEKVYHNSTLSIKEIPLLFFVLLQKYSAGDNLFVVGRRLDFYTKELVVLNAFQYFSESKAIPLIRLSWKN